MAVSVSAAEPFVGSTKDLIAHLQRQIDRASEEGNYTQMQALRLDLARYYAATGDYGLAARQYELLLASRPSKRERVDFFIQLGKMRDALHDYGTAIQAYEDALHDDPNAWDAGLSLARAYSRIDLNTTALTVYKRCMQKRPKAAEAYAGAAEVYQRLGLLRLAIAHYEKALALSPTPQSYLGMADCYVRLADTPHAAEVLQKAKEVLPRAAYDDRLGEIYQKQGDLQSACVAWEEAYRSDPQRGDVQLNLIMVYEDLGRHAEADHLLKRMLSEYPLSPLVHFMRAWVFYLRGDPRAASQEVQTVQALDPTEVVRHYNDRLMALLRKDKRNG